LLHIYNELPTTLVTNGATPSRAVPSATASCECVSPVSRQPVPVSGGGAFSHMVARSRMRLQEALEKPPNQGGFWQRWYSIPEPGLGHQVGPGPYRGHLQAGFAGGIGARNYKVMNGRNPMEIELSSHRNLPYHRHRSGTQQPGSCRSASSYERGSTRKRTGPCNDPAAFKQVLLFATRNN